MTDNSHALSLFAALGIAVFEPAEPGCLVLAGTPPAWLEELPGAGTFAGSASIRVEEAFPFLSGFLVVAGVFWAARERAPLLSGIWIQSGRDGIDLALRARAVIADGRPFLLIERLEEDYEERKDVLQRSRQRGLDNERLERRAHELTGANREAEQAVRDKSEFLAGMSHDLRTPLNAMLGFSKLLLQGRAGELNEKQRGYLNHVTQAAGHLLDLINDVLDLSRIEAGFLELRREVFPFDHALEEVLATIVPLAHAKGIVIETTPGPHLVNADRVRLRQILYNLLSNAIKFTGQNGLISIAASLTPPWFEVCVSDNGPGIHPSEHAAIFERYTQARRSGQDPLPDSTPEGSGLGLAITRQLVAQHGGDIRVESAPGAGSRFTFRLPAIP